MRAEVSFRCDGISRTGSDAVKAAIASHLQQCAGEAVMSLVEDITHHMIELSTRMATAHAQQQVLAHGQADDAPRMLYKRCTFLCDHMLSGRQHKKESKVRDVCEGLGLTGALFYGKPSVVIVEGSESEIEQFVREAGRQGKAMKKRKTQSLVVGNADRRYQKFVLVQAIGKTDTLDTGTLKEHLEDLGIGAKFKHIIGVEELQ
ncbi:hypothetical protein SARC_10832 [Sphaeroforma arctica JP610]|uniref:Uncharacterized protein n=1 Tax=Sphaeroforma arctica JP610 TaxID=667725 RepID=A0A0L0FIV5_9EUKA|nr:hypothetical protein SARC_10832 [Sphaeroforma arctica JP610]KNC76680.1 hypothetical protein SARC_10832 [Sphaeroforma arctica JP610]|eukprot:XP_014150582.1 hypothetical protein SARC_10832 [Sphaeroforma arctica JP610]